jgi:hypothetical protein
VNGRPAAADYLAETIANMHDGGMFIALPVKI